jgi:hypothetical protein
VRSILSILFLLLALLLVGCGGSNGSAINGNWTATLTEPNGTPAFGFTTTLNSTGNSGVSVTNLKFNTTNSCFGSGTTETGGFTLSGTLSGVTTGGFRMTIQSSNTGSTGSNTLTLNGTLTNNTINGTWSLSGTGAGCTGGGTFTMNRT